MIRLMIVQFPVVQALLYVGYSIYATEVEKATDIFFMPFMVISIITCAYAMGLFIQLLVPVLPEEYTIRGKFIVAQMILLVCQLEPAIAKIITDNTWALNNLDVKYPMSVEIYCNCKYGLNYGITST